MQKIKIKIKLERVFVDTCQRGYKTRET